MLYYKTCLSSCITPSPPLTLRRTDTHTHKICTQEGCWGELWGLSNTCVHRGVSVVRGALFRIIKGQRWRGEEEMGRRGVGGGRRRRGRDRKLKIAQNCQPLWKQAFAKSHLPQSKRFEVSWNNRFTMHSTFFSTWLSPSLQRAAVEGGEEAEYFVHLDANVYTKSQDLKVLFSQIDSTTLIAVNEMLCELSVRSCGVLFQLMSVSSKTLQLSIHRLFFYVNTLRLKLKLHKDIWVLV